MDPSSGLSGRSGEAQLLQGGGHMGYTLGNGRVTGRGMPGWWYKVYSVGYIACRCIAPCAGSRVHTRCSAALHAALPSRMEATS